MLANIVNMMVLPVIALLILMVGPEIRNKILNHEQKKKGTNPYRHNAPLAYADEDNLYRTTVYSSYWGGHKPIGNIRKMIDSDARMRNRRT